MKPNTRIRQGSARLLQAWGLIALLAPSGAGAQSRFTIVGEEQTWTSLIGAGSEYVAAQAVAGPTKPVVMAGNFDTAVQFPADITVALAATAGNGSVFAGLLDYDNADSRWEVGLAPQQVDKLEPKSLVVGSSPTSTALDLAVVDRNRYFLTGLIDDGTYFQNRTGTNHFLTAAAVGPPQRGWVALGNSGTFSSAHYVDATLQPKALSTDPAGSFLVIVGQERDVAMTDYDGDDARVHRYALPLPASGTPLPAPDSIVDSALDVTDLGEVAVTSDGRTWVGGTKSGIGKLGGLTDVWLGEADFNASQIVDELRAGSEGLDRLYAMERGAHGEVYVAFTVSGRDVSFGVLAYDLDTSPPVPAAISTHAFVGMIKSDGTPGWMSPLGLSQAAGGQLVPAGLSVDTAGHVCVAIQGTGTWLIEGIAQNLTGAGQVTVNGKGRVIDFTATPTLGTANAGAVPDLENRLVLGQTGVQSAFSTLESLAVPQTSHFIRWIDPSLPSHTIGALSTLVTATGAQVHNELDFAAYDTVGVSVWATPDQLRVLGNNPQILIMADPLIISPDEGGFGEVADPGWGLARLFDPYLVEADEPSAHYFFPSGHVTGDPSPAAPKTVRVYVIDKGLEAAEPFVFENLPGQGGLPIIFDGANGVNVDALIHPVDNGESVPDTTSNHPRQVINLLAAANLGSAAGTAMEIIPGDMYSGASPEQGNSLTYASYVSHAIIECLAHAAERIPQLPTMIVLASSGQDPLDQVGIGGAIDQAIAQGVPVIISAGNSPGGAQAGTFVPAMHGDKNGVITVGATAFNANPPANPTLAQLNPLYANGNTDNSGQIISLYAPGGSVDTGHGAASGTSFSCALVAGLAATYLSQHPEATPAEVEAALVQLSVRDKARNLNLARSACAFGAWLYREELGEQASGPELDFEHDADEDGDSDFWEFLGSSDPTDSGSRAKVPVDFTLNGKLATLSAWLPHAVVDSGSVLQDGCWSLPVTLQIGDNLQQWLEPEPDQVMIGPVVDGLQELRFLIDLEAYSEDRCFLRFDFGPPASP